MPVDRQLLVMLDQAAVAVHYRLAPEHVYPAAIEDYWAVVCWLAGHAAELGGDPKRLVVATAEYDPLSSEGARYAERLRAAGVPVTYLDGKGLVHGFL
jgi:acetyl esterase/lipase